MLQREGTARRAGKAGGVLLAMAAVASAPLVATVAGAAYAEAPAPARDPGTPAEPARTLTRAALPCLDEGPVTFLCGVSNPEDLFVVPGTRWVLTSAFAPPGGINIVDARRKTPIALFTPANAKVRFDRETYRECPGPPTEADRARFTTLGVHVGPARRGVHRVYATRAPANVVHVFDLEVRGAPSLTWVGCVPGPPNGLTNAVVGLPDGGFLVSSFYDPRPGTPASRSRAEAGEITGEVWSWRPGQGLTKVPGTESSGANGIEVSRDGRFLFVSQWGSRTFMRVTLGATPPARRVVPMPFRPDNVHWAPDGSLLVAGHTDTSGGVVKVDPATLEVSPWVYRDDTASFAHFSGAVEIGKELWVGSSRSPRIAIYKLPIAR